jgi:hypothetical protein
MARIDLDQDVARRAGVAKRGMPERKLFRDLVWVTVVKLLALTAIYFLFFVSPAPVDVARHFAPALSADLQR